MTIVVHSKNLFTDWKRPKLWSFWHGSHLPGSIIVSLSDTSCTRQKRFKNAITDEEFSLPDICFNFSYWPWAFICLRTMMTTNVEWSAFSDIFKFDNSFSWLTKKHLSYVIQIDVPNTWMPESSVKSPDMYDANAQNSLTGASIIILV